MRNKRWWVSGLSLVLASGVTIGYVGERARANGIPSTKALIYSGELRDATGASLTGTKSIQVVLGDAASGPASQQCGDATPSQVPLVVGSFQVTLPDSCKALVQSTPDLWAEVFVDGASLGRSKLGAAPYAVEAERATDLASPQRDRLVPTGTVVAFAGTTPPSGWLSCDGAAVSRSANASLFAAIGTTYGPGDGSTTFNLPDLRGRLPIGTGTGTGLTGRSLGKTYGTENIALTVGQLPSHAHGVSDPGHAHPAQGSTFIQGGASLPNAGISVGGASYGYSPQTGAATTGISIQATGSGQPVPIVPPALALGFIIKA
jgi:microcystin-dependent protein